MLDSFSLDVKERIRQSINIVDLVSEYVQLTPRGRVYVGLCPWHDDSKPSLQVDPERQTFRCWVCAIGGDIFSFMMKMENVSFPEALQMLAERAGVELPKRPQKRKFFSDPGHFSGSSGKNVGETAESSTSENPDYSSFSGKKTLHDAAAWAENQYYEYFRQLPENDLARKYLQERGISQENVDKFRIGFAPNDWNWLTNRAKQNTNLLRDLHTTGYLGFSDERKSYYERFRGRLLFPIHDAQGRSVGIGGRVIPGIPTTNESAKYLNTPETPLFSKHRLLYGLDLAKPSIHKKKRVLVMEGYTDTIIAHQYGFTEAVAVLGTALGIDHIRILNRLADSIYLVLDGDEPGQKRAAQVLELFVAEKVDVRILTLPEEDDPAEFLAEYGAEKFEELLQTRTNDALTHAYKLYTKDLEFSSIHQTEMALDKLLGLIASGAEHTQGNDFGVLTYREEKMLQQLAFSFSISEDFLRRRLRELRDKARHDAFIRESWQQKRQAQDELEQQVQRDSIPLQTPENAQNKTFIPDESEALIGAEDGEDGMYADVFPEGLSSRVALKNSTENDSFEKTPDFTSEPQLLTKEAFEAHADEINWELFGKMNAWEKELVEILLAWPSLLGRVRERITPERFRFVPARELYLRMCEMADDEMEPTFERVLLSFESQQMKSWMISLEAASIWNREKYDIEQVMVLLEQTISNFERFQMESRKFVDLSVFNSSSLNTEQKLDLLDALILEKQRKNGIFPEEREGAANAENDTPDLNDDWENPKN